MNWRSINYSWGVRRVFIPLVMMGLGACLEAQTLEEWTKQKKLQTSYKLNQIVALSAYLEVAKKGYEVAQVGWNMVGDIQNGEFSLHADYLRVLVAVHPLVSDYPKAGEILKLYRQIRNEVDWLKLDKADFRMLGSEDIESMANFNNKVIQRADQILIALEQVLTSHTYEMGYGERQAAIDGLHIKIQELLLAMKSYHSRFRSLELSRKRKEIQQQQVNSFYDVR